MYKVSVIIPTTGSDQLHRAISSVVSQTFETQCYVVADGPDAHSNSLKVCNNFSNDVKLCLLPENVGANGFYGHRIYAAFTHLVNTDYIIYLDQDNFFNNDHVKTCIETIEKNNLDWCYSLRNIYNPGYVCQDNCESLGKWQSFNGYNLIDTNCYCIKKDIAIRVASAWHGGWGQDRIFFQVISQHFTKYDCTRKHTVNYSLGGKTNGTNDQFFLYGNDKMDIFYKGDFPWLREI